MFGHSHKITLHCLECSPSPGATRKIIQEENPCPAVPVDQRDGAVAVLLHGPLHPQHHLQHPGAAEAGEHWLRQTPEETSVR